MSVGAFLNPNRPDGVPVVPSEVPGVTVERARPRVAPSSLRTDVAGFVGQSRRGPIGACVRVEGAEGFGKLFGPVASGEAAALAARAYFANGGRVLHMVRVAGPGGRRACALLDLECGGEGLAEEGGFSADAYEVEASSPGAWGNTVRVRLSYRRQGVDGRSHVDLFVRSEGEPPEDLRGLDPADLEDQVARLSDLIRLVPVKRPHSGAAASATDPATDPADAAAQLAAAARRSRRTTWRWEQTLQGGADSKPEVVDYLEAVLALMDEAEVALMAAPDLHETFPPPGDVNAGTNGEALAVQARMVREAAATLDRLVLLDAPPDRIAPSEVFAWLDELAVDVQEGDLRSVSAGDGRLPAGASAIARTSAVYFPRLGVLDPAALLSDPLRAIAASGPVAGLISRLDREIGPYQTPANASLLDVFDVDLAPRPSEQAVLNGRGVNLIRPMAGRGLVVWGGRCPSSAGAPVFVAHRRTLHRLVRALRAVAEPLVFERGDVAALAVTRAAATLLLEAFRAGALKGTRPEEAFRIAATTESSAGAVRVLCAVDVAPAMPLEFIRLVVGLSSEDQLRLIESEAIPT